LNLPTTAKTGQAVSGFVDSFDTSTDAKSAGAGAGVSGGGGSATAGSDGSFQIVFPTAGKYLVSATRAKSVRGSQWVTVSDEAKPVPVAPVTEKQINQKRRAGARANCRAVHPSKSGPDYIACIRTANALGHTVTKKDKRIAARAKCVHNYPQPSDSRTRCIRDANALGR
jgi:hypothetical protein